MVGGLASVDPQRQLGLVRDFSSSCPRSFLSDFLLLSCIILVSISSSSFVLAVPMREVYCVGYTFRAWHPRSLQSILNGPLYFGLLGSCFVAWKKNALSLIIIVTVQMVKRNITEFTLIQSLNDVEAAPRSHMLGYRFGQLAGLIHGSARRGTLIPRRALQFGSLRQLGSLYRAFFFFTTSIGVLRLCQMEINRILPFLGILHNDGFQARLLICQEMHLLNVYFFVYTMMRVTVLIISFALKLRLKQIINVHNYYLILHPSVLINVTSVLFLVLKDAPPPND